MIESFFLDNLILIGSSMIIFEIIWFAYCMVNDKSGVVVFIPIVLMLVLFAGFGFNAIYLINEDQKAFCLDNGYIDSKGKYCINQENGFLIEQEVRLVNKEWLFIKNNKEKPSGGD